MLKILSNELEENVEGRICNWRKHCIIFEQLINTKESRKNLRAIEAQLLRLVPTENCNSVMIRSVFFPLYPMEGSLKVSTYTSKEWNLCNFIGLPMFATMEHIMSVLPSTSWKQEVFWAAIESRKLSIFSRSSSNQAISCWKKMAKKFFNYFDVSV